MFSRTGGSDFPDKLKLLVSGPPKSGKALAHGTPVLTPEGWVPVERLGVGDHVIGNDGLPTRVEGVFPQGVTSLREVHTDDGGRVVVSGDHLWTVLPRGNSVCTQTTDEIAKRIEDDRRYGYLPMPAPLQVRDRLVEEHLPPYALGLLLGDGQLGNGSITFSKPEPALHQALAELLPDCELSEPYGNRGQTVRINGLRPYIVDLGLAVGSEEKFIPQRYLWTSVENRMALLAGLLDTDGGMNGRSTCFYTSSEQLRDEVVTLVRSLGGVAKVRTKVEPYYTYRGERRLGMPAHNVSIRLPRELGCPFRLTSKALAWEATGTQKRPPTRRIVSINPVEDGESTCIKVAASDGLFVTQDHMVTHNTSLLGTVPNIVIADTEPHANNLQSVAHLNLPYVTVQSMDALRQLQMVLSQESLRQQAAGSLGMNAIEAVAIDTLDTLQAIMKRERLKEVRQSQFLRDDWAWLKEEMASILEGFTALPLHVIFVVHTKTKEIGKGDDARTVVLPGLEGSIAEQIAGMVGYSLLSFRKQEIRPDGTPYTKYWLRAEGDETYDFLGNRTAGRLPDVIEPDFQAIYDAAMAGRPKPAPQESIEIQTTGQTQTAQPVEQNQAQNTGQAEQPAQPAAQSAPQQAPPEQPAKAPDDEPVNAAAITHVKKVYDACGLSFPEETIKGLTLGEARTLVRMWQACQQDAAEGKAPENSTPQGEMAEYLRAMSWVAEESAKAEEPAKKAESIEPKVDGTIDQVMAYVTGPGEQPDLAKVQEAYDLEAGKARPRTSLISALERMGAKPPQPTPTPVQSAEPTANDTATPPSETVTPGAEAADSTPTEEQAVATAKEGLGAEVIGEEAREDAPCEECGKPVDDLDIARLGKGRFERWLCVQDYIAQTKK